MTQHGEDDMLSSAAAPDASCFEDKKILVISSVYSGGKTTQRKLLMNDDSNREFIVSYTTRLPRPGEVDGIDYHFLRTGRTEAEAEAEFMRLVENGELFEHTRLYGNYYGTPRKQLEEGIAAGKQMIADVNIEGLWALKKAYPDQVQGIFLLPPSIEILKARLQKRLMQAREALNDSWAELEKEKDMHIKQAMEMLKEAPFYDTVIAQEKFRPKAVYQMIKNALNTPINETFTKKPKPPSNDS